MKWKLLFVPKEDKVNRIVEKLKRMKSRVLKGLPFGGAFQNVALEKRINLGN